MNEDNIKVLIIGTDINAYYMSRCYHELTGKKADIIILDMNNIEVYPTVDLITNVVHNTESNNVNTTIINGEVLMFDHKLTLKIDLEKLKQQVDFITSRLIKNSEN